MYKYLILLLIVVSSCKESTFSESEHIVVDITSNSFDENFKKESIKLKDVFVHKSKMADGDSIYFIGMCYTGNDSLTTFFGGFKGENSFNKAKYYWTSDTSINMTLFNTNTDSTEEVYLRGNKNGKGGQNGYVTD